MAEIESTVGRQRVRPLTHKFGPLCRRPVAGIHPWEPLLGPGPVQRQLVLRHAGRRALVVAPLPPPSTAATTFAAIGHLPHQRRQNKHSQQTHRQSTAATKNHNHCCCCCCCCCGCCCYYRLIPMNSLLFLEVQLTTRQYLVSRKDDWPQLLLSLLREYPKVEEKDQ